MTEQIKEQATEQVVEPVVESEVEQVIEPTAEQNEASIALVESREAIAVTEPVQELPLDLKAPALYINRELSHLQFNIRVLEQALDETHPLMERLMFLLIFSSNLDEFFEIRVAELMGQLKYSRESVGPDALHPQAVMNRIGEICSAQVERQYKILNETIFPELEKEDIHFQRRRDWSDEQIEWIRVFF